ncbi:unnamed protein product [Angiostrongylus costaricensis]|uniref:Oxidored_molyb domain-containing protein n=1 Tax=Angiostrongylus costaricensis TaxID=334426 RepID=A0A0R3PHQ8_ANGCS|nr:unnamed protein product [Angiostrongylus costaricensis]
MMLDESLERAEPTGLPLHATGKMEDLLVPALVTRPLTGLQVVQVIDLSWGGWHSGSDVGYYEHGASSIPLPAN